MSDIKQINHDYLKDYLSNKNNYIYFSQIQTGEEAKTEYENSIKIGSNEFQNDTLIEIADKKIRLGSFNVLEDENVEKKIKALHDKYRSDDADSLIIGMYTDCNTELRAEKLFKIVRRYGLNVAGIKFVNEIDVEKNKNLFMYNWKNNPTSYLKGSIKNPDNSYKQNTFKTQYVLYKDSLIKKVKKIN